MSRARLAVAAGLGLLCGCCGTLTHQPMFAPTEVVGCPECEAATEISEGPALEEYSAPTTTVPAPVPTQPPPAMVAPPMQPQPIVPPLQPQPTVPPLATPPPSTAPRLVPQPQPQSQPEPYRPDTSSATGWRR